MKYTRQPSVHKQNKNVLNERVLLSFKRFRLLWQFVIVAAVMFTTTACRDVPFTSQQTRIIDGVVEIGVPVRNAKVAAFKWQNLKRGELLKECETNSEGQYSLEYASQYDGPVLIVSSQGRYLDPVTKLEESIDSVEYLAAPIVSPGMKTKVNLNAWTTFVVSRAEGTRSAYPSDSETIAKNLLLIGSHLRNEKNPVAILSAVSGDILKQSMSGDSDILLLSLSHIGLSKLAQSKSTTLSHMIHFLAQDISDGVWSGFVNGEKLFTDKNQRESADSQATRYFLAQAIEDYLDEVEKNQSLRFDRASLHREGAFFDSLSMDSREALYPSSEPAKSFRKLEQVPVPDPNPVTEPEPEPSTTKPEPMPEPVKHPATDNNLAAAEEDLTLSLLATGGNIDRALFWLINQNKIEAVKLAKRRGANLNGATPEGDRPLCIAIEKNQVEMVKLLIKEGAEINYIASDFRTPLVRAAFNGLVEIIKIFIDAGVDVNAAPADSLPALHMAVRNNQIGSIEALLAASANVNLIAGGGAAIHEAARWGNENALRSLLEKGANPYLRNENGKTVFDIVDSRSSPENERLKEILHSYR